MIRGVSALNRDGTTTGAPGSSISDALPGGVDHAVEVAKNSDIVILALGIDNTVEKEGGPRRAVPHSARALPSCSSSNSPWPHRPRTLPPPTGTHGDRTSVDLPQPQHALAKAILALGKPTAIALINGGMLALEVS